VDRPQPIWLPNHRSFEENKPFALEAVAKLARSRSLLEWPFPFPPRVVLPLGVAIVEGRKPRLVLDGGYVNLFLKYLAFKYEGVRERPGCMLACRAACCGWAACDASMACSSNTP